MERLVRNPPASPRCRSLVFLVLFSAIATSAAIQGQQAQEADQGNATASDKGAAREAVEVKFADESNVRVILLDRSIPLETPYGKLLIPAGDIHRIDFGRRLSQEARRRIESAIADLGHAEFKRRDSATAELCTFREKGYHALLNAAKSKDQEVVRRSELILEKLRDPVAEDLLEIPPFDTVYTSKSMIAGHITLDGFSVRTLAFGDQTIKLSDARSLRSVSGIPTQREANRDALPDPGTLAGYQAHIGKTLTFKVTGPPLGAAIGNVFGTDVYTLDSSLAGAAVHAGVIRPG